MLNNAAVLIRSFISNTWNLINSTVVPGTTFTYGRMFIALMIIGLSISVFHVIFGGSSQGESSRTGSTDNPKISEERKHDEK